MATYVNNLRLKEIATGDEEGTWGASTNTNLELIADAFGSGTEAIVTNANTHTTTLADGAADEGRAIFLKYTGTLDSACTITIAPNTVNKLWLIENATSGSQNIIISQGSGANITIGNGNIAAVFTDGAGSGAAVLDAFADLELMTSLTVGTDAIVGDDLTLKSDAAVLGFGADTDVTLTHVADTGLLLNSTRQLQFFDSSQRIAASSATVLSIAATDEIDLQATAIDVNGTVDMSSTLTVAGNADLNGDLDVDGTTNLDAVDIDGAVQIDSTVTVGVDDTGYDVKFFGDTASAYMLWDASTDDLVLAGAAGIDLAGDLDVDGTTNLDVVDIDGAVDMASTLTLAGNADFNGDLDVDGTTNLDVVDIDGAVDMATTLTLGGNADFNGDLDVDGTTNLDNTDVDGTLVVDGSNISLDSTSTLNIDNSNTSNGITIGTATSGVPVSIGHTTSEVTVNDNLTVTGTLTLGSGAELTEAELEMLDGITAGTVAASKAVVVDSNKDIGTFRNLTIDGVFTDGNYTFDTSGNVTGLGTVASGAITSSGVVTGTGFTIGSAVINEAELETIDGVTAGTVAASKAVVVDSNKDIASFRNITLTGELDAATLDVSGAIDVAGTANLDVVDIDGAVDMASTLQVDGAITSSAGATITIADNNPALTLTSTDADANTGPNMRLYRNSGSPADNDHVGEINFEGRNDNSQDVVYANIESRIKDASDGSEDGYFDFETMVAGTLSSRMIMNETATIINEDSLDLDFRVEGNGDANLLFVDAGNDEVGIGTNTPDGRLDVTHSQNATSNFYFQNPDTTDSSSRAYLNVVSGNRSVQLGAIQGDHGYINVTDGANLYFQDGGSTNMYLTGDNGHLLLNSTSDTGRQLTVKHDIALETSDSTNYYQVYAHTDDSFRINYNAAGNDELVIDSSGNLAILSGAKLYLDGASNTYIHESAADTIQMVVGGTSHFQVQGDGVIIPSAHNLFLDGGGDTYITEGSANVMRFFAGGSKQFEVTGTNMSVVGALSKGSGSFRIDHPLDSMKDTHDLVHSFIEGPRADLMYRGSVQLSGGTATVDLDAAATMTDGTWELLCRDPQVWVQNEDGWTQVRGSVSGSTLTITAQDGDCTDTVSWLVVAERQDEHMMDTNWTDDNGRVIVEPEKPAEDEE